MLYIDTVNTAFGLAGSVSPIISVFHGIHSIALSLTKSAIRSAENLLSMGELKTLKRISANLFDLMTDTGTTGLKNMKIANSVNGVFVAIDEWQKIDPPLPVEVMSSVVPDVVIEPGSIMGEGKVILTVKNMHTGTLSISPSVQIFDSKGLVDVPDSRSVSVLPDETVIIEIPFTIPRSTMMDASGYYAVMTLNLAEPATMSIGAVEGPYIAHFFAGTRDQIEAYHGKYEVTQPMGREIAGGEQDEGIIDISGDVGELRVFMAAEPGSELQLSLYSEDGKHISVVNGAEVNEMDGAVIGGLINVGDHIKVLKPQEGKYRVVVKSPEGTDEQRYALIIEKLPNLGTVADVYTPSVVMSSENEIGFQIDLFETSGHGDIEEFSFNVSELKDENGNVIPEGSFKFTDVSGDPVVERIPAGYGISAYAVADLPEHTPDGIYRGILTVEVAGNSMNPALVKQTEIMSVTDSVYGWFEKDSPASDWEVYEYRVPVIIALDKSVPEIPVLYPIEQPSEEKPHTVQLRGEAAKEARLVIWVDEELAGFAMADQEGMFDVSLSLSEGVHEVYVTAVNIYGTESQPSEKYTVQIAGTVDDKAPILHIPDDIVVEAEGITTFVDIGEATAEDDSEVTITNDALQEFPIGTTVVTWIATDAEGNVATAVQKVTVVDTTPPQLIVPDDITVETEEMQTEVDIGEAVAYDIFEVTITNNAPEVFDVGTTEVTWRAVDANGNSTEDNQRVTVIYKSPTPTPTSTPTSTPTPTPTPTPTSTPTPTPTSTQTLTPTPTSTPTPTPTSTPTSKPDPTPVGPPVGPPVGTPVGGTEVTPTPTPTPTPDTTEEPQETEVPNFIPADLPIEIAASSRMCEEGQNIEFTITYKNRLKSMLSNIDIEVVIPEHMTVIKSGEGKVDGERIVWNISQIEEDESGSISFKVRTDSLEEAEVRETVRAVVTQIEGIKNEGYSNSEIEVLLYSDRYESEEVYSRYIQGYTDGNFRPDNPITRAEAASIFAKALGLELNEKVQTHYSDVEADHWAIGYIEAVTKAGLFTGYGNGEFRPRAYITRAEMAAVIFKFLGCEDVEPIQKHFDDLEKHWAQNCIESIYRFDIVKGYGDGSYQPDRNITGQKRW